MERRGGQAASPRDLPLGPQAPSSAFFYLAPGLSHLQDSGPFAIILSGYLCFSPIREQAIRGHGLRVWSTPGAPCQALSAQCVHIEWRRIRQRESFLLWSYDSYPNLWPLKLYAVLGKGVHKN